MVREPRDMSIGGGGDDGDDVDVDDVDGDGSLNNGPAGAFVVLPPPLPCSVTDLCNAASAV